MPTVSLVKIGEKSESGLNEIGVNIRQALCMTQGGEFDKTIEEKINGNDIQFVEYFDKNKYWCMEAEVSGKNLNGEERTYIFVSYFDDFTIKNIFEKIILSFKNVDTTADWKTYRNEQYGFEMKYPENKTTLIKSEDYGFKISADMYNANIIYVIPVDTNNLIFSPKGSGSFKYDPNTNTWTPFYSGEDICYAFQYLGPDKIPSYYDANLMVDGYPRTNIVITNKGFALKIFRTADDGPVAELQEKIVNTFELINDTKPLEQNCSNLK